MVWELLATLDVTTWLVVVLATILSLYWLFNRDVRNLPPTPGVALPVIGHLYLLKKDPRGQFKEWAAKFGDVFRLQMGPQTVIVFNSLAVIKEALVKQADYFSDRPSKTFINVHTPYKDMGVVFSSGPNWKEQRSTSLSILRNFGMGKNILAEKISEEVTAFINEISTKKGEAWDMKNFTNISVSNVICAIIFGRRFEFGDPKFVRMMKAMNELIFRATSASAENFFPFLKYLPFDLFKIHRRLFLIEDVRSFCKGMIDHIRENYDPDNIDSYVAAYLEEIKKKKQTGQSTHLDEMNLNRNIDNLFLAGTETTSNTVLWSLLYALNNPETQKKIYMEILEHVGNERMPSMADKPKLKFLTAFIMEVQRMASIIPFSLPHECSHEATVAGYTIPKGVQIFPYLYAVLRSEQIWGDPDIFRPERFLDGQGNVISREELIPFSIGRRICLGEALAKMELFLYLSSLFQRFEFIPADKKNIPPVQVVFGGVLAPVPFEIRCVERNR